MLIKNCPNSTQLNTALDAAFDHISQRDLTDIVHILDAALPFVRKDEPNEDAVLTARNLLLNAALAPRPYPPHRYIRPDDTDQESAPDPGPVTPSRLWPTDPAA